MSKDLDSAASTEGAPSDAGAGADALPGETGAEGTADTPISAEMQEIIEATIGQVRQEYEGEDGRLARLQSAKDKEIAQLKKQLRQRQAEQGEKAKELMDRGNYAEAAQILAAQVQELQGSQQASQREAEAADWISLIMGDLGYDLENDEQAAKTAAAWLGKIMQNPETAWDFAMDVSTQRVQAEQDRADQAQKELRKMEDSLPELVKAAVTKQLIEAGLAPEPTDEGGGSKKKEEDWRSQSAQKLIADGIQKHRQAAIRRTKDR